MVPGGSKKGKNVDQFAPIKWDSDSHCKKRRFNDRQGIVYDKVIQVQDVHTAKRGRIQEYVSYYQNYEILKDSNNKVARRRE